MFERFNGNVVPFADESTSTNRTVFGSETQSDDIDDNLNADFKKGWEIVGLNDNPTREDFNAMGYTLGYLTSYLYQNGVAEYNLLQEYKTNSIAIGADGNIYQSLVDNNIGNVLTDTTKWVCIASKNSTVNSIAELKTISNIESINVLGYYEKGDGGGGIFCWDTTSTATDNGGTIIQATGITTGRWKRVFSGAVNVKWFGAKEDDSFDNSPIFDYLARNNYDVEIDDGTFLCNSTIGNFSEIKFKGSKNTTIKTSNDIALFSISGKCIVENINILQESTGLGAAFKTNLTNLQLAYSSFKNITVSNFKLGMYVRYSLWCSFKNMQFLNCKAGLIFSGNDNEATFYDVRPSWNSGSNGFFHNQNTLDNILCDGGELGIFYCGTGASMNNITAQEQSSTGVSNVILPSGQYGTGLWINGNSNYVSEATIHTFYSEGTQNPIRTTRGRIKIDGFFVQGGAVGAKYKAVIINDSGLVDIYNSWGQDYFENLIEFNNTITTPTVSGNVPSVTVPAQKYTGVGYYNVERSYKKYKHVITHNVGTPSGTTYTLSDVSPNTNEVYKVSVVGIQDGAFHRIGEFILYSGQTASLKSIVTVQAGANFTVTQNGFKPMITVNTTTSMILTVYTEKVGAENVSPTSTITVA